MNLKPKLKTCFENLLLQCDIKMLKLKYFNKISTRKYNINPNLGVVVVVG